MNKNELINKIKSGQTKGLVNAYICENVLQLGAVCVGLWEGNCAKVLLALVALRGI